MSLEHTFNVAGNVPGTIQTLSDMIFDNVHRSPLIIDYDGQIHEEPVKNP
jgi:hypothetical protein